jgi:hypothetical protein
MTDKKRVGLVPSIQARLKSRPTKDIDFLAQNIPNDATVRPLVPMTVFCLIPTH